MNRSDRISTALKCLVIGIAIIFAAGFQFTDKDTERTTAEMTGGGDMHRGKELVRQVGCGSCHQISGIRGADANIGPSLDRIAGRMFIAGVLDNSPDHMIQWLKDPPGVDQKTAMPNLGLSDQDARDIAAYLYTIK